MSYVNRGTSVVVFILIIIPVVAGCSSVRTSGVYNEDLSEKKPYVFSFEGSPEAAAASLRQELLPSGFSIASEDTYGGGASYVFEKTLSNDEKFETTAYFEDATGTSTGTQGGRLVFLLSENGGGTVSVEMTPHIVTTIQREDNAFRSSSEEEEAQAARGHPLPMKYGRALAEKEGWMLESPPRAEVFQSDGGGGQTASAGSQPSSRTADDPSSQDQEASQTGDSSMPPYGFGAQYAAPAFGLSGMYDFTDKISGQAVLGFFGGLQSYSGRVLYRFKKEKAYDVYGFGTVGVWQYSGPGTSSSTTGFGAGVGLEYSWRKVLGSSDLPPLFGNIELGFVSLSGDLTGYDNFSSFVYGFGIHYRFGN